MIISYLKIKKKTNQLQASPWWKMAQRVLFSVIDIQRNSVDCHLTIPHIILLLSNQCLVCEMILQLQTFLHKFSVCPVVSIRQLSPSFGFLTNHLDFHTFSSNNLQGIHLKIICQVYANTRLQRCNKDNHFTYQ